MRSFSFTQRGEWRNPISPGYELTDGEISLQGINEYDFEEFVAEVWNHRGWDTHVTQGSADKGIDVIAKKDFPYEEKILIQAKRYGSGSRVGSPEMQKYASLHRFSSGLLYE